MSRPYYAITGGIGSGKSHVAQLLAARGIGVYDCDAAAKRLMQSSSELKLGLKQLVGPAVYDAEGHLQKRVLATFLLASEQHKRAVNQVVHPAVARDFEQSGLAWLESAILFDSGFDRRLPFSGVVCVVAPLAVRLQRVMQRDQIGLSPALQWIHAQLPQREMAQRSSAVLLNDGRADVNQQIDTLLAALSSPKTESMIVKNK